MHTDDNYVTYNDLGKASRIEESHAGIRYDIVYGPDGGRWESSLYKTGYQWPDTVRRYVGDMEIVSSGPSEVCRFYYLGHGVVLRKVNNSVTPLYAFTDNLGSVTRLYTEAGTEKFRAQYDPWGVQVVSRNDVNFTRGYCGHEMLNDFQLINMNGRMYDPVLGRFLSPDNYVQMPTSAQSFNRYSYCLNNPLKYTDPSGELFGIDDLLLFNIATSAYISAVCGAFNSSMNGGSAFGGAFRGIGSSLLLSIGSYGVGEMFGHGMVSPYNELARGLAHGIVSGTANCIDGGNFCSGFLSGAISSWSSSASKALGASPWASIGLSTISGALSSELAGDSWVGGAINGLMIGALNHEWQYINGENVYVLDEVVCSAPRLSNGGVIAAIHASLDILGMIPAIGEFADGTNAVIYAFQGDMTNAGLSAAAMIPVVGNFATGGKYAVKSIELVNKLGITNGKRISSSEVLDLAEAFLGKGYAEPVKNSGRYVSKDGMRVFRMGTNDILGKHGGGPHVNFEVLSPNSKGKMTIIVNRHVYLIRK